MSSLAQAVNPQGGAVRAGEDGALSFWHYVEVRKYDYGRGTPEAWAFIAFARGDPSFPKIGSWTELRDYLAPIGAEPELLRAARSVWRSFSAYRSRLRHRARDGSRIMAR